jgi:hypothetical protein
MGRNSRGGLGGGGGRFWVMAALLGVACRNGGSVQTEQYSTQDGSERLVGRACTGFEKDSGFGAGLLPGVPGAAGESGAGEERGFSFVYEGTGSALRLRVSDGSGHVVAERVYDNAFVESGRSDELKVDAGKEQLRFVATGAASCPGD